MMKRITPSILVAFLGTLLPSFAQSVAHASRADLKACSACIRAHEEFLASDAMQGRGSGTHDELVAATYIASQLRQYGITPAGDNGGYIQRVPVVRRKVTSAPQLDFTPPAGTTSVAPIVWTYGKDFSAALLAQTEFSGPLRKLGAEKLLSKDAPRIDSGSVVQVIGSDTTKIREAAFAVAGKGAIAVLILVRKQSFEKASKELPRVNDALEDDSGQDLAFNVIRLSESADRALKQVPDGTTVHFRAPFSETKGSTWNAVGILRGTDTALQHQVILLSAHLDHLGIGEPVQGDDIYNGADDDASGTTAVLELARALGGTRPSRTVVFALFGSEELGGLGSTYFSTHPPVQLKDLAANIEFEMLGRPDAALKPSTLWITGWERSNLGPALAQHGAQLVGDPHPEENFFSRSDNYVLAKKGVVAQSISSYGLHEDYHRPSDDLAHLDLKHMDEAIGSLLAPINWLVNSNFQPKWNPGGKP